MCLTMKVKKIKTNNLQNIKILRLEKANSKIFSEKSMKNLYGNSFILLKLQKGKFRHK